MEREKKRRIILNNKKDDSSGYELKTLVENMAQKECLLFARKFKIQTLILYRYFSV